MPLFSQNKIDTTRTMKDTQDDRKQINSNARRETLIKIQLLNENFSIPLNLRIYQKVMINDYIAPHKFSQEELSTGMSNDELISFEKNRLKTRRMLSGLYGEDFINTENILAALGITKEQLIAVVAILKFFVFSSINLN
jgi:hypothetical protein